MPRGCKLSAYKTNLDAQLYDTKEPPVNDFLKHDQAMNTRTIAAGDSAVKAAWTPLCASQ